jgi:serine/threonine-protein kinase
MDVDMCPVHRVPTIEASTLDGHGDAFKADDEIEGRYRVIRLLGKGAMGSVYLAVQLNMDREVAVKTLLKSLLSDYKLVQRFYREARAVSKLDHPNIIRTYDFGIDSRTKVPFIVMEYVQGEELADMLKMPGALSEELTCTLLTQVAKALVEAHSKGIIHRDLKPQNIRVRTLADGDLQAKVLDFGIAKVLQGDQENEKLTGTGMTVGTPPYMSPEQILGGVIDARADLYSLGCILHELLTGSTPYTAADRLESFMMHVNAKVPPLPDTLIDGNPPSEGLCILHRSLLAKDMNSRPRDAATVAKVFKALASGQTVDITQAIADLRVGHVTGPVQAMSGAELAQISQEATDAAIPTDPKQLVLPQDSPLTSALNQAATERAPVQPVSTGPAITVESVESAPRDAPPAAPGPAPGQVVPSAVQAGRPWLLPVSIAAAAAVAIVIAIGPGGGDTAPAGEAINNTSSSSTKPTLKRSKPSVGQSSQPAAEPRPTAGSKLKRVSLVSTPPGAMVFHGETELGETPLDVWFPEGIDERALKLSRPGHVPREVLLSRTTASPHKVTLRPIAIEAQPVKALAKPVAPKKTKQTVKKVIKAKTPAPKATKEQFETW